MASFGDKPTIRGDRVVLRPLGPNDTDDLLALLEDAGTRHLTGTHDIFTRDEVALWCATRAEQSDRLDFAVTDATDGSWIGECALNDWSAGHRSCNLRIALVPERTGTGLGRETVRLLVDHVFTALPIDRIGVDVYEFNERALRMFRSLGFAPEGRLRGHLRTADGDHDVVILGLLRFEWSFHRAVA